MPKPLPPAPHGKPHSEGELVSTLTLFSLDGSKPQVEAQYNPKEFQIERTIPWTEHKHVNGASPKQKGQNANDRGALSLEFTGNQPRSITVELLFDGYESGTSVQPQIDTLESMAQPIDPSSTTEKKKRPHFLVLLWGEMARPFRCVMEQLTIKYTVMSPEGRALRATATVKLKEANRMD